MLGIKGSNNESSILSENYKVKYCQTLLGN